MTCVDCNKTFPEDTYRDHTSCISEAERYEGHLFKAPKAKTKKNPQEIWNEVVEAAASDASSAPASIRSYVGNLVNYGNVPRNEKKFGNFVRNSLNLRSDAAIGELWKFLSDKQQEAQAAQDTALASAVTKASVPEGGVKRKAASESDGTGSVSGDGVEKKKEKKPKSAAVAAEGSGATGGERADWGKAISKALKAAPGRKMATGDLRRVCFTALEGATNGMDKADKKSSFKAALKAHPKAQKEGKGDEAVVTYKK